MAKRAKKAKTAKKGGAKRVVVTLLIIAAAIALLVFVADRISSKKELRNTRTTYGVENEGFKGIFLSAEKYLKETRGATVERFTKLARFLPADSVAVLPEPADLGDDATGAVRAAEKGTVFVVVSEYPEIYSDMLTEAARGLDVPMSASDTEEFTVLRCGNGAFYVATGPEYKSMFNLNLKSDNSVGSRFLVFLDKLCESTGYRKVLFDECYSGLASNPAPDILGWGLILGLVWLAVALVIFLLSKAQRFGAPEKFAAVEKRNETENVSALAELYRRTGSGSIGFKIHMEALADDIAAATGMQDVSGFDEIMENALASDRFKGSGLDRLVEIYRNAENERITPRMLNNLIEKTEIIRKERLQ
ncbi:MAG: hypothetical protein J6U38_03655 [Clostridia bacterium]|nr:hypothetical protein [Clostridia bacterium]MBO7503442.1 hypothetical protein [Clostridia bacterium]MBO7659447.1 hypothetical protein [Clostridia bacterium]MBP5665643.1 hypothetical protein [Clostridia bacterium]MBP5767281.1 hypothetical protein [Clostridia bacterium]